MNDYFDWAYSTYYCSTHPQPGSLARALGRQASARTTRVESFVSGSRRAKQAHELGVIDLEAGSAVGKLDA